LVGVIGRVFKVPGRLVWMLCRWKERGVAVPDAGMNGG
jgi:hypothetical protein